MERVDISQLLGQMRGMQSQIRSSAGVAETGAQNGVIRHNLEVDPAKKLSFSSVMSNAINHVNASQMQAGGLQNRFERGDASVSIVEVMVANQKAGIEFRGLLEVRNKFVEAYRRVMDMPI